MSLTVAYESGDPDSRVLPDSRILAEIDYGPRHGRGPDSPRRLTVGLEPLSAPGCREVWRVPRVLDSGWDGGIGRVECEDYLFAHLLAEEDGSDLARLTCDCYRSLLDLLRRRGFPFPLRMWSYLPDIHRQVGGLERYRGFCVGRERAFREAGLDELRFPAATAIGSDAPGLLVLLLAGRTPGRPVENPRQISAYCYPPRYGPRPPSFARGLLLPDSGSRLLISGTASVVGHRSCHCGDALAQLRETLANLESLAEAAGLRSRWQGDDTTPLLKVFLREPDHLGTVAAGLEQWSRGRAQVLYVKGEVCREDLAIEIEGVL